MKKIGKLIRIGLFGMICMMIAATKAEATAAEGLERRVAGFDLSAETMTMDKVNQAKAVIAEYDALSVKEQRALNVETREKILSVRKGINDVFRCGPEAWYRYKDGVLTVFGRGVLYDYIENFDEKNLENDVRKRSYQNYASDTKKVVIEDGITKIGRGAFACFSGMEELQIRRRQTKVIIGKAAFFECTNLKIISMKNVSAIEFCGFGKCKKLKKADLPEGLVSVGKSAFLECVGLKMVVFPVSLRKVGDYCFFGCKRLSVVEEKGRVKQCGKFIFYEAKKKGKVICRSKKAARSTFVKKAKASGWKILPKGTKKGVHTGK
ncbi:MAG: leucine-rich repeat domain-containing protein [Eubacteriales bacterium]|nr:leucine-rich repeat domain-containing protein [Eubacteriales bacterium]